MVRAYLLLMVLVALCHAAHASDERSLGSRTKGVATERRLALVIGNSGYSDAPLKNPVNDADVMARTLKETGFEVIVRKNADRRALFSAIKEFGQKLRKHDVGLFYYAGHGVQVDNANYLLPVDVRNSELQDADDLYRDALPLTYLMERLRDVGTSNIVILDACRDNPFLAKLSRSTSRGLAKVVTPASTSILYATDPGNTASDGTDGDNGIFTRRLVESINREGLELVDVMREVAMAVSRDTNGAQRPVFDGLLSSKFYFKATPTPSAENGTSDSAAFRFDGLTATDSRTGLMWAKSGDLPNKPLSFEEAEDYVKHLNYGGYTDWRLPTKAELGLLLEDAGRRPIAYLTRLGFTDVKPGKYWSSTTYRYGGLSAGLAAYFVNLSDRNFNSSSVSSSYYYVWPVRDSQK